MISPVPHILAMSPYALAQLGATEGKRLVSLSQNESLRPPSPLAVDAAANAARTGQNYPDPDWTELREPSLTSTTFLQRASSAAPGRWN